MPWKETCVTDQRRAFIEDLMRGAGSVKELCAKYGISEKTGHKWKSRFMEHGYAGLCDESRAPHTSPGQLGEDAVVRIIAIRQAHPSWGPKKIKALYERGYPGEPVPSESSIYRVLGKAELVARRPARRVDCRGADSMRRLIPAEKPNDVWTVDFKGWWMSGGEKCLPLTVRDLASRNILEVRLMESTSADAVRVRFDRLFARHGLPRAIRSDNGAPFATMTGFLGLTTLSAWWMSLGIVPDRIQPGKPGQNGSHERMHADISREIQGRIPGGVEANQAAIDAWVDEYNNVRPHEALGMKAPAEVYRDSERAYAPDAEIEYPIGFMPRKVNSRGCVKIDGLRIFVGGALRGLTVGVQPAGDGTGTLWLAEFPIATIDTKTASAQPIDILGEVSD